MVFKQSKAPYSNLLRIATWMIFIKASCYNVEPNYFTNYQNTAVILNVKGNDP